jgi:hypothetical protein
MSWVRRHRKLTVAAAARAHLILSPIDRGWSFRLQAEELSRSDSV